MTTGDAHLLPLTVCLSDGLYDSGWSDNIIRRHKNETAGANVHVHASANTRTMKIFNYCLSFLTRDFVTDGCAVSFLISEDVTLESLDVSAVFVNALSIKDI